MAITVIGVDFRTAALEVREQIALSPQQVLELLHVIAAEKIFAEAMILSTCNRSEFYFCCEQDEPTAVAHMLSHLAQVKGLATEPRDVPFFRYDGPAAVEHLFRVVSSLESQIVGEHEIMGQVKQAYSLACQARTAKLLLHKLAHWALRAGKRVFSETDLGKGTASVSQAAVELATHVFSDLSDKTALLVGAGQTAELAAQALLRNGLCRLIVANRTPSRAKELVDGFVRWHALQKTAPDEMDSSKITCPALLKLLAQCSLPAPSADTAQLSARAVGLEDIPSVINEADLVICSTGASEPVLTRQGLAHVLHRRRGSLLMIDIAVPRDIEESIGELPNVFLYNIDGLQKLIDQNLQRRRGEIPRAEAIVDDELAAFNQWLSSLEVVPTIKDLEQRIMALQKAELDKYHRKFSPEQQAQLQEFSRALCNKILHGPKSFLRTLGSNGAAETSDLAAVQMLRQMFNLDATEEPK